MPPKQAGIFIFFLVFLSFWPKVILLSISANNTGEQHDDEPSNDGHVQVCTASIGHPSHRKSPSPAGSDLIISLGFQSE